jgi:hypothetical protein
MDDAATNEDLVGRCLVAYEQLTALGEEIENEWSYVQDLSTSWRHRLEEFTNARGGEAFGPNERAAIDRAIDEIGRIGDPHRAIDWLSTFPQVVLVTFGERP